LAGNFLSHQDCEVPVVCDVFEPNRQRAVKAAREARGAPVEAIVDYRQALDRKDIDAIAIATPDHWHCPILIDACKAGKDVYVEKPLSNAIEPCLRAIEAVEAHHRVVQFGTQQRSCPHFQEAARIVRSGALGKVYHAAIFMPGGDGQPAAPPSDPPPGLDWEKFQGHATRHPYSVTRQHSWSSYYDYGGSTLTNWGAHLTDVVCWYLDDSPPLSATGSGAYARQGKPDPERFPDTFTASWSYEKFVMSYGNWAPGWPTPGIGIPQVGNFFVGTAGVMLVNRTGYMVCPPQGRSRAANQPSPVKPVEYRFTSERDAFEAMDKAHARNFLDCMRSRQKPAAPIEVGFRATLPTLLGVLAIRHGKPYTWDGRQAKPLG
jgi:predicted dehydrogenase